MRKLIRNLYIRENCHPAKSSLVVWFQIPLWFSVSFALRNMSGAVPTDENNPGKPFLGNLYRIEIDIMVLIMISHRLYSTF